MIKRTSLEIDEEYLKELKIRGMTISGAIIAFLKTSPDQMKKEINILEETIIKLQKVITQYGERIYQLEHHKSSSQPE